MAHVHDRWFMEVTGPDGRTRKVKTTRHGKGLRYRVRYLDADGRERSKSFADGDKAMAKDFMTNVQADIIRGTYIDPEAGNVTLRKYAAQWLDARTSDTVTVANHRQHLDLHILPALGGKRLTQLARSPSAVQQWISGLGTAPSYTRQIVVTLSAVLGAAVEDGRIAANPCKSRNVSIPKPPRRKLIPWTRSQVEAVRAALPGRYQAMADCGAGLGLRQGEILGLGTDEIEWLRSTVHIRRQVKIVDGRPVFAFPKHDHDRDVPLQENVSLRLAAHIAEHGTAPITLPWHEPKNRRRHGKPVTVELLFATAAGTVPGRQVFNRCQWKPALRAAGLEDSRENGTHALRHYFASVLLAGGVDAKALSEYLGHHDAGFTLRTYAHLMPSAAGRALRAVENAFSEHGDGPLAAHLGENRV